MAKILKVKIKREQTAGGTHYTYPKEYDPKKIQVLAYESVLPENYNVVVTRGNNDEYLMGIVKDVDAGKFLESKDIEEIDYKVAETLGNIWTKQVFKITNPERVVEICQKVIKSQPITINDRKVLDPDDIEPGITKSRGFKEALDDLLAKL